MHVCAEENNLPSASRLCSIHRCIRVAQNVLRAINLPVAQSYPDARTGSNLLLTNQERFGEALTYSSGDTHRFRRGRDFFKQDDELIAPKPAHQVGPRFADTSQEAAGGRGKQLISGQMPEAIIHNLELVEV